MLRLGRKSALSAIKFPIRNLENSSDNKESNVRKLLREKIAQDKESLKWRKTNEEAGIVNTKLKYFGNDDQTSDYIIAMQKPISLNPRDWINSWEKKMEKKERIMQQFIPERLQLLGPDLAAAHFILHRGGAVKFLNSKNWMRADKNGEFDLPNLFTPQYKVEGLKCDNMKLYYEGLENLRWMQELKFLSFRNVKTFDDWCLDRISGSQNYKLEILDISGTNVTARGFSCLYRLNNLNLLVVDNPNISLEFELTCSMLEEALPKLKIVSASSVHNQDEPK